MATAGKRRSECGGVRSVRRTSKRRARPTQPGDRLSQQKRQPCWRPAPAARERTASPLSDSLRPARRTVSTPSPSSVVLRGLTAHPLRLGCRPFRGQAPCSGFVAPPSPYRSGYASVGRPAGSGASTLSVHGLFGNGPPEAGLTAPPLLRLAALSGDRETPHAAVGQTTAAPAGGDPPSGKPQAEPAEAPPFEGKEAWHATPAGEWPGRGPMGTFAGRSRGAGAGRERGPRRRSRKRRPRDRTEAGVLAYRARSDSAPPVRAVSSPGVVWNMLFVSPAAG